MKQQLGLSPWLAAGLLLFTACDTTVIAAETDWGYGDNKSTKKAEPVQELKAGPAKPLNAVSSPGKIPPSVTHKAMPKAAKTVPKKSGAPAGAATMPPPSMVKPNPPAPVNYFARTKPPSSARHSPDVAAAASEPEQTSGGSDEDAITDWLELLSLSSKQPLDDDQRSRFRSQLLHKLGTDRRQEVISILKFWPQTAQEIKYGIDQREGFASLFRALLRFESKSKQLSAEDGVILPEVLGAERIALPGDPPLTEDAVDAYADMACFMYEQRHPGKTIDAIDNRTIFASVICQKYNNAPSPSAKKAMANFALSWAKFKIAWADAGPPQREQLLASLEAGSKPPAELNAKVVDLIINAGPWATLKH
ncbi:MAG TPA: hypothetical protein V6C69_12160 [Trichormus sp.]|jgi:hypothetical protein